MEEEDDEESEDEEESEEFNWFGPKYKEPKEWDYVDVIDIAGKKEVNVTAAIVNDIKSKDFEAFLMANIPLEIDKFTDVNAYSKDGSNIVISVIRFVSSKDEVDNFAEALGIVMPHSNYVVFANFKDGDAYKYTFEEGKIICEKEIGEKEYTKADMIYMTDEQKNELLADG